MNLLFEKIYQTRAQLPYMVRSWNDVQKEAATLTDKDGGAILEYSDLSGIINDHFFNYFLILNHSAENIDTAEGSTMVFNKFQSWKNQRIYNIRRAWEALNTEYEPLYNYDRYEDQATDKDTIEHGKKVATNTDLKVGTNTDLKESANTDTTTSRNTDLKVSNNTDLQTSHASNIKASTASDLTSSVNTDVTETEGQSTRTDKRPTWTADAQTTAQELTSPGAKHTEGAAADNYTNTTGSAANNYTETVGSAAGNYDKTEGLAESNYSQTAGSAVSNFDRTEGSELNNYIHKEGDESDNYSRTVGDDSDNFTEESGRTVDTKNIGARHMYGNIGTTKNQEMLSDELEVRRINFKKDLVSEWVHSISYSMEVL